MMSNDFIPSDSQSAHNQQEQEKRGPQQQMAQKAAAKLQLQPDAAENALRKK